MDLKFTFGGASPDHHDHGDAPSGIPLPFTATAGLSSSSVLEVRARLEGADVVAEALSGDGVAYSTSRVTIGAAPSGPVAANAPASLEGNAALARAARSAISRAVAGLEGPLAESVSAVVLSLGGAETEVLAEWDVVQDSGACALVITETLQRRIGVAAGTTIRIDAV